MKRSAHWGVTSKITNSAADGAQTKPLNFPSGFGLQFIARKHKEKRAIL